MKTKTLKIVITVLMAIFTLCTVSNAALATWTDITPTKPNNANMQPVIEIAGNILWLIQAASGIAAVLLVAIFGFKFIMGSANEKADYQKSFIPLIVGVIVVFAASGIANLILGTFANSGEAK